MKARHSVGALLVCAGLGLAAKDARATLVAETFPGITCHAVSGGAIGEFFGSVENISSASELNVSCPFVRDGASATGLSSGSTVQVFDRNPSVAVSCTLNFEFASGSSIFLGQNTQSTAAGFFSSNLATLTYPAMTGGDYYYASCIIPRVDPSNGHSHVIRFKLNSNE
jgi:hypothetical protein